jgi:hypothetical protein
MDAQKTLAMITRFARDMRRAWIFSVRMASSDFRRAEEAADRFAGLAMSQEIEAGYAETRYLTGGFFDPLKASNRLNVGKVSLMSRFLADVREGAVEGMIGLNGRQRSELSAYSRMLRGSLSDGLNSGTLPKFNEGDIQRQVNALHSTLLSNRSLIIAEDAARATTNRGVDMALEQLAGQGIIIPRTWNTSGDEKVRSSHAAMAGQVRPTGQAFITGNGYYLMHPHDGMAPTSETANCRCYLTTEKPHA